MSKRKFFKHSVNIEIICEDVPLDHNDIEREAKIVFGFNGQGPSSVAILPTSTYNEITSMEVVEFVNSEGGDPAFEYMLDSNGEDIEADNSCEECKAKMPDDAPSPFSRYHQDTCELFAPNLPRK